jgi:GT2 family glycosyltransferase
MVSGDFITDIVDLIGKDNKMLIGGRIVDWAGGWNEFDVDGKHYVIPYAEGWLLGCTKLGWKGLGGFDIKYGRFDYEDLDLSTKALSLGYNIVGLNSNKLKHLGSQTISKLNIDRQSITEHNRKVFIDKWISFIPTLDLG